MKWVPLCCNSYLGASFRNIGQKKDLYKSKMGNNPILLSKSKPDGLEQLLPMDDSPSAAKSFTDSQLEVFDCRHGIMILHLLATLMFAPSLAAWLQVCRFYLSEWFSTNSSMLPSSLVIASSGMTYSMKVCFRILIMPAAPVTSHSIAISMDQKPQGSVLFKSLVTPFYLWTWSCIRCW